MRDHMKHWAFGLASKESFVTGGPRGGRRKEMISALRLQSPSFCLGPEPLNPFSLNPLNLSEGFPCVA